MLRILPLLLVLFVVQDRDPTRTVVVHAGVQSRMATVKDDEALARRLLEKIDYAELATLLK